MPHGILYCYWLQMKQAANHSTCLDLHYCYQSDLVIFVSQPLKIVLKFIEKNLIESWTFFRWISYWEVGCTVNYLPAEH
jgi:hypothetical protein